MVRTFDLSEFKSERWDGRPTQLSDSEREPIPMLLARFDSDNMVMPRNLPARYPPGPWPGQMRADMVAAFLDFENTAELVAAVKRGEAPPPSAMRKGEKAEPVWSLAHLEHFSAPSIAALDNEAGIENLENSYMRVPRTIQPLPRYVRRKWLKGHTWAYFFEPPTWARKNGCPVCAEALGSDYESARDKAKSVLLPVFDSWRTGGLSDVVPQRALPGTFDWLVKIFKEHRTWSEIDRKTRRMYEQGLNLVGDHILKDGTRVGSKLLLSFTRGFVDALYAKILIVEETDAEGKTIKRERRRYANAAMTACRRAWFVGIRSQEKLVPATNPFSNMGLKTRSPGQSRRETPTATWDELTAFRNKAKELGYGSIATAALTAWEWLQREEHLFGAFELSTTLPSDLTACTSSIPRRGRKLGGRFLTTQNGHCFPN